MKQTTQSGFLPAQPASSTLNGILATTHLESRHDDARQKITAVWKKVLELPQVSIYMNFCELGGDSLRIIQVLSLLQQDYPALTVVDLFAYPTINALANHLENATNITELKLKSQLRGEKRREHFMAVREHKAQQVCYSQALRHTYH